jgi:hypothetical protein
METKARSVSSSSANDGGNPNRRANFQFQKPCQRFRVDRFVSLRGLIAVAKAVVTITAYNSEGYSKRICSMSDLQVHMNDARLKDPGMSESESLGKVGIVVDPKDFPEMDRFVVSVELVKSN